MKILYLSFFAVAQKIGKRIMAAEALREVFEL